MNNVPTSPSIRNQSPQQIGDSEWAEVSSQQQAALYSEVVAIVDFDAPHLETALQQLPSNAELVLLDPMFDLLDQITKAVSIRSGIKQLHMVVQWEPECLVLGDYITDGATIREESQKIATWKDSFCESTRLVLHSPPDVQWDADGFLQQFSVCCETNFQISS